MIATMNKMKRILVIDDERGPRESLRILLKGKYDIECVDNVDSGVESLKANPPDLIIMDIRMPKKTGIEGLRDIRALDKEISVVMLTGFGALETAQEALRLGANDYLKKPFDTTEIMELVEKYVKRTEQTRRSASATKQIREMNSQLVDELAQKERLANIGQASAEFAHDLRNPLTVVVGYLQLLTDQLSEIQQSTGEVYTDTVEYVEIIEKNIQRCHEMAQQWQDQANKDQALMDETSIHDLLTDLVQSVEPLAAACQAELTSSSSCQNERVKVSQSQLLRAMHNILANAIHAVSDEENGKINLSATREGDKVKIVVSDNGCGIDEDTLANVFKPFFTTRDKDKGTGLGLAITKRIIEDHDGTVNMESEVGKGTRVTIHLPLLTTA